MATHVPPPWVLASMTFLVMTNAFVHEVQLTIGTMFAMGFAMCCLLDPYTPGGEPFIWFPRNHTHQDRLRDDFERTHTHLRPLGDYTTFGAPVPGRP